MNKIGKSGAMGGISKMAWTTSSANKKAIGPTRLVMMGLGGAIGAGIFVASAVCVHLAGPGVIVAYLIGGLITALVIMMLGEMGMVEPVTGSFSVYADRYFGHYLGFVSGWMYWTCGVLTMGSEVVAAAILTRWWLPHWSLGSLCLIYSVIITIINFLDVKMFTRVEAWFSYIKVGALMLFIITGAWYLFSGLAPAHFTVRGGFFPNGTRGVLSSLLLVMAAYAGIHVIGLAMSNVQEPARTVPRAVYLLGAAVIILYVGASTVLTGLVPWTQVNVKASPFVPALRSMGIPAVGSILNAVILSAVLTAMNTNMYGVPRMLQSLGRRKEAPGFLTRVNDKKIPVYALIVSAAVLFAFVGLTYVLPQRIFVYIASAGAFTAIFNWIVICFTYLRFRRQRAAENRQKGQMKLWGYPYTTYLALALLFLVVLTIPLGPDQWVGLVGGLAALAVYSGVYLLVYQKAKV